MPRSRSGLLSYSIIITYDFLRFLLLFVGTLKLDRAKIY
jgi:hypothetical protein